VRREGVREEKRAAERALSTIVTDCVCDVEDRKLRSEWFVAAGEWCLYRRLSLHVGNGMSKDVAVLLLGIDRDGTSDDCSTQGWDMEAGK
jgi:hypothetical protein